MPYQGVLLMILLGCVVALFLVGRKYKKKYFRSLDLLIFLVRNKRLSPEEYKLAVGEYPPPEIIISPQPVAENRNSSETPPVEEARVIQEETPTRPALALNSMLFIGGLFVVLAGAIFATTTWLYLPDILRTVIICSVSFVFFAVSAIAKRLFKIIQTAVAFYTIGVFFLPIGVLTIGYFSLLGRYFSLDGAGRFWLYCAASLFLCLACLIGSIKYRLRYFTEVFFFGITATFLFFLEAFTLPIVIVTLLLYAYAALLIGIGIWAKKANTTASPFSHIVEALPLFSLSNALVIAAVACILSDGGVWMAMGTIILSLFFLTEFFHGRKDRSGGNVLLLVLTYGLYFLQYIEMVINNGYTWTKQLVLFGTLVILVYIGYRERRRAFLALSMIPCVTLLWGLTYLGIPKILSNGCTVSLLLALLLVLLSYLDKKLSLSPRTAASDVIVVISLCLSVAVDWVFAFSNNGSHPPRENPLYGSILSLLLLAAALFFFLFEKTKRKISAVMGVMLPLVLLLSYIPVHYLLPADRLSGYILVLFYFALCIMGILFSILGRNNKQASLVDTSILIALCLTGPIFCALRIFDEGKPYPLFLLLLSLYLAARLYMKGRGNDPVWDKKARYIESLLLGLSTYTAVIVASSDWFLVHTSYILVLWASVAAILFCAAGILLGRAGKLPLGFTYLQKVGAYGLTLFSVLLPLTYQNHFSLYLLLVGILILILAAWAEYLSGYAYLAAWISPLSLTALVNIYLSATPNTHSNFSRKLALTALVILFLLAGRLIHKKVIAQLSGKEKRRYVIDWISISAIFPLGLIFIYSLSESTLSLPCILMSLYILSFWGRIDGQKSKQNIATAAAAFLFLSLWGQPFVTLSDHLFTYVSLILFVGYFVFLRWVIWKNHAKTLDMLVFISACISLFVLANLALLSGKISDALVIGIVALLMMSLSFVCKRKKWFILSTLTILLLAIYMTRSFWTHIAWWIYLLAAGLLLIGLAAANEIMKQKGISLKKSATHIFHDWS